MDDGRRMRDLRRAAARATKRLGLRVSTPTGAQTPRLIDLVTDGTLYLGVGLAAAFGCGLLLREIVEAVRG